jgi:hypothetical protein
VQFCSHGDSASRRPPVGAVCGEIASGLLGRFEPANGRFTFLCAAAEVSDLDQTRTFSQAQAPWPRGTAAHGAPSCQRRVSSGNMQKSLYVGHCKRRRKKRGRPSLSLRAPGRAPLARASILCQASTTARPITEQPCSVGGPSCRNTQSIQSTAKATSPRRRRASSAPKSKKRSASSRKL